MLNYQKKNKDNISFLPGFTIIGAVITIIAIVALTTIAIVSYRLITDSTTSSISEIQTDENSNNSKTSNNNKTSSNSAESSNSDNTDENQTNTSSNLRFFANYIGGIAQNIKNNTAPGQIDEIKDSPLNQIVAGDGYTCEVINGIRIYCWGWNHYGQLGNNSTDDSLVPVTVDMSGVLNGKTIKSISAWVNHACAIASDNQAYCWGYNGAGELGNNSTTNSSIPIAVDTSGVLNGKTIKSISAGVFYTCAIASDNQAYCWGRNNYGELGNNSTNNSLVPVAVDKFGTLNGKTIKLVASGGLFACVIASDNQPYCWGDNEFGQLGNNSTTDSLIPIAVDMSGILSGKTVKSISTGDYHTCIIASDNQAYCWGVNWGGQLGNNSTTNSLVPIAVDTSGVLNGKTIKSIDTGEDNTCVIASDEQVYCWGGNGEGQLGNNTIDDSLVPIAVDTSGVLNGKTIKSIDTGEGHTCIIASDDQAYCWGKNFDGQLGNNSTDDSLIPVRVIYPGS